MNWSVGLTLWPGMRLRSDRHTFKIAFPAAPEKVFSCATLTKYQLEYYAVTQIVLPRSIWDPSIRLKKMKKIHS